MRLSFSHVDGVKVFQDEILLEQLLNVLVCVEVEKPLRLIRVVFPDAFPIPTAMAALFALL